MSTKEELARALQDFRNGTDRSLAAAGRIEVALDKLFPDDEEVADMVRALSSYRPGGGEYLYGEEDIEKLCDWALSPSCSCCAHLTQISTMTRLPEFVPIWKQNAFRRNELGRPVLRSRT